MRGGIFETLKNLPMPFSFTHIWFIIFPGIDFWIWNTFPSEFWRHHPIFYPSFQFCCRKFNATLIFHRFYFYLLYIYNMWYTHPPFVSGIIKFYDNIPCCRSICMLYGSFQTRKSWFSVNGNCTWLIYLMISSPLFSQASLSRYIQVLNLLDRCFNLGSSSISVFCLILREISWSLSQLTDWDFYLGNHIFRVPCLLLPFCSNTFLFHWCNVFFL